LKGTEDAFVTAIDPSQAFTSALIFSTYFGGSGSDSSAGIALDSETGHVYIAGTTDSTDLPTVNPTQATFGGGLDIFVAELDPTGAPLYFSTYLGGTGDDQGSRVAVDSVGNVFVGGLTNSTDFPTANAIQATNSGGYDVTLTEFSDGVLFFSTYLGGTSDDVNVPGQGPLGAITLDASGNLYVATYSGSSDFPIIAGAVQATTKGNGDAIVVKIDTQTNGSAVVLTPASWNFGDVNVGTTNPPLKVVKLLNAGSADLTVTNVNVQVSRTDTTSMNTVFPENNTCTFGPVPGGTTCTINVFFAPTTLGPQTAVIKITDSAGNHYVDLAGYGISNGAAGGLPPSLDFGNQAVGTTSAPQTVTMTNTGVGSLGITSITVSANFTLVTSGNPCGSSLGAGVSCDISVVFAPLSTGILTGQLKVTNDGASSPSLVDLSGTGTPPANPVPMIHQPLVPMAAAPGSGAFTLTVNGTGFVSPGFAQGSVVTWNGSPRETTFVNSGKLTALIMAADVASAGTALVTVVNPAPGGGTSNAVFFQVTNATPSVPLSRTDYPTGGSPFFLDLTEADLNVDGKADLIVVQNILENYSVSVFLGKGDGTFQTRLDNAVGARADGVTAADFNGDGLLDLAVTRYYQNTVAVLLGNGDGTFQPLVEFATAPNPWGITTGDVNADGRLDLAVRSPSSVSVLLGNGDGTFQNHLDLATGSSSEPLEVVTGDFNLDGKLDLATANNFGSTVSVLLGNGDGTFQAHIDLPTGADPRSVTTADFNGDGKLDLATANRADSTVSVLLGNGNGTFQAHVDFATDLNPEPMTLGDFNGDGKLDIAVANTDTLTLSILLGNGDGTFQPPQNFAAGNRPVAVTTGDFNGDGRLDLATANDSDDTVSVLLQTTAPGPAVGLSTSSVNFRGNPVNFPADCLTKLVTLTNTGGGDLLIESITADTPFFAILATDDPCPVGSGPLSPGRSCVIGVQFDPPTVGIFDDRVLRIESNASGSPHTVALSGTGTPACQLIARVRAVTLLRGTEAQDFGIEDSKPSCSPVNLNLSCSVANPAACLLNPAVIAPSGASTLRVSNLKAVTAETLQVRVDSTSEFRTASELITVNFSDFAFTHAPDWVSIRAGETATYGLAVRPVNRLAGEVALVCSGAPRGATCTVTPSQITLDGASLAQVKVKVTTTGRAGALPTFHLPGGWARHAVPLLLALLGLIVTVSYARRDRRRHVAATKLALAAALLAVLLWASCGGGGGMNFNSGGTPAGTFTLTITGTYTNPTSIGPATLTNSTTVLLKVN